MEIPTDWWDELRKAYPKRAGDNGWVAVRMLVPRRMTEGHTWERILAGTLAYAAHCRKSGEEGTMFVKQAKTFYGPNAYFDEWADMDTRTPAEIASQKRLEAATARAEKAGFRKPGPGELAEQYESSLKDFERGQSTGLGQPKFAVVR